MSQEDSLAPLTGEQREAQDRSDYERVVDARASARTLQRLAIAAGVLGCIALGVIAVAYLLGELSAEAAVTAAFSSGFFTILSGATAYGSGVNLDINAYRLEREIRRGRD